MSLDLIEALALAPELAEWDGLGLAVQAYQKRALPLIDWLADLARRGRRRLMVRLVKGAYWDSEVKRSQERGLDGYPVYTRKLATDVSYLAAARRLLAAGSAFYPQFATHNAHTVAAVLELAGEPPRLGIPAPARHGRGALRRNPRAGGRTRPRRCRVYAPVGSHEELLAYLVRRLLENGANTSFVNRIVDDKQPIDEIIADPVTRLARLPVKPHPHIPLPADLYAPARQNSRGHRPRRPAGPDAHCATTSPPRSVSRGMPRRSSAASSSPARPHRSSTRATIAARSEAWSQPGPKQLGRALDRAHHAAPAWDRRPAGSAPRSSNTPPTSTKATAPS